MNKTFEYFTKIDLCYEYYTCWHLSLHERFRLKMVLSSSMILSNSPFASPSLPTSTVRYCSTTLSPNCHKIYNNRKFNLLKIFLQNSLPLSCTQLLFWIYRVPSWKLFPWIMMGSSELEDLRLLQWHPETENYQHVLHREMEMPLLKLMHLSLLITLSFWNK